MKKQSSISTRPTKPAQHVEHLKTADEHTRRGEWHLAFFYLDLAGG